MLHSLRVIMCLLKTEYLTNMGIKMLSSYVLCRSKMEFAEDASHGSLDLIEWILEELLQSNFYHGKDFQINSSKCFI